MRNISGKLDATAENMILIELSITTRLIIQKIISFYGH